jgi:hypothetical protein
MRYRAFRFGNHEPECGAGLNQNADFSRCAKWERKEVNSKWEWTFTGGIPIQKLASILTGTFGNLVTAALGCNSI